MKLFDFQEKGLAEVAHRDRCAFYWDMGTGKTFVGAEKLIQLNKPKSLVVCQKSKVQDWVDHFQMKYGLSNVVFDLTNKKDFESFLKPYNDPYPDIGIINYDLLIRRPDLLRLENFTLMLDESQAIQNESAKRTKFIMKMKPSGGTEYDSGRKD